MSKYVRLVRKRSLLAVLLVLVLAAAACGGDGDTGAEDGGAPDGPTITVGSANFPENVILGEIYAQVLADAGYDVSKRLDLGSREVIWPSLRSGEIDFLPEYIGSALAAGFGVEDAPADSQEGADALTERFSEDDITVLDFAPAQDKNVYVVTQTYAEENEIESISDLADLEGPIRLGAPPECEGRPTCLQGLTEVYGLDNIEFVSIQEFSARVAALENGEIELAALFSTQPVIKENGWIALEDDEGITPAENIVPVVRDEIVDEYGDDFTSLVNSVTAEITTDTLLDLNGQVELEAEDPEDVARAWLEENGFLEA